jgi:hypothetical protein
LRPASAFESGETPDADTINDASEALNAMVKHWQASGIHIWRTQEAILVVQNRHRFAGLARFRRLGFWYMRSATVNWAYETT